MIASPYFHRKATNLEALKFNKYHRALRFEEVGYVWFEEMRFCVYVKFEVFVDSK